MLSPEGATDYFLRHFGAQGRVIICLGLKPQLHALSPFGAYPFL